MYNLFESIKNFLCFPDKDSQKLVPVFERGTIKITEPVFYTFEKFDTNKVITAKGAPFQLEITQANIQQRAYELWKNSGCPDGQDVDFWCKAERELNTQNK